MPSRHEQTDGRSQYPAGLRVSFVDLRSVPLPEELAELDRYERDRAARYSLANRRRYQVAHCRLRAMIRSFDGVGAQPLEFVRGRYGKPSLAHGVKCHFSLSYCGDVAMIALTGNAEIGIDLERVRAIEAVEELAASHFAAEETRALLVCTPVARDRAFLQGWVRKEACVKAVGYGLWLPTDSFVSGIGTDAEVVKLKLDERDVRVAVSSVAHAPAGHVAAWASVLRDQ